MGFRLEFLGLFAGSLEAVFGGGIGGGERGVLGCGSGFGEFSVGDARGLRLDWVGWGGGAFVNDAVFVHREVFHIGVVHEDEFSGEGGWAAEFKGLGSIAR